LPQYEDQPAHVEAASTQVASVVVVVHLLQAFLQLVVIQSEYVAQWPAVAAVVHAVSSSTLVQAAAPHRAQVLLQLELIQAV
jgi:hypothetical protein